MLGIQDQFLENRHAILKYEMNPLDFLRMNQDFSERMREKENTTSHSKRKG